MERTPDARGSERVRIELARDTLTFSSAHFLQLPDKTSEPLHGHNYTVAARIESVVDQYGYIVNFSILKNVLLSITHGLNHRVLIPGASERVSLTSENHEIMVLVDGKRYLFPEADTTILPIKNTTCEELATFIGQTLQSKITANSFELTVEECPGQGATWRSCLYD